MIITILKLRDRKILGKTKEFYNEFKKIKVKKNKFDELHELVSIYDDTTLEDVVNNKEMVLEILGLEEHSLLIYTKTAIKEYIYTQLEKEINEIDE